MNDTTLGDTLELFLQGPEHSDYHELHVSPNGHRLQLHFPRPGFLRECPEVGMDELTIEEPVFQYSVDTTPQGWRVTAFLPLRELWKETEPLKGKIFRISISRYEYSEGNLQPVLSSTSAHEVLNFHRIEEWTEIRI